MGHTRTRSAILDTQVEEEEVSVVAKKTAGKTRAVEPDEEEEVVPVTKAKGKGKKVVPTMINEPGPESERPQRRNLPGPWPNLHLSWKRNPRRTRCSSRRHHPHNRDRIPSCVPG
jgi:hypothetical protein